MGLRLLVRDLLLSESDPEEFSSMRGGAFLRVAERVTGPKYPSLRSDGVGDGDMTRGV
jgi:hypothetical protein